MDKALLLDGKKIAALEHQLRRRFTCNAYGIEIVRPERDLYREFAVHVTFTNSRAYKFTMAIAEWLIEIGFSVDYTGRVPSRRRGQPGWYTLKVRS